MQVSPATGNAARSYLPMMLVAGFTVVSVEVVWPAPFTAGIQT